MSAPRADTPFSLRPDPPPATPGNAAAEAGDHLSVVALINVVLRRRRLVLIPPLAVLIVGLLLPLVEAKPRLLPEAHSVLNIEGGQAAPAPSQGLAAQLGLVAPQQTSGGFPYPRIVASRDFLRRLLAHRFTYVDSGRTITGTLFELSNIRSDTAGLAQERAIRWLRANISVAAEPDGMTRLKVRMRSKALAESLSYRVVDELNDANLRMRQAKLSRDRRATYTQLLEAQNELRNAEARAEAFLVRNRDYQNSPVLRFEFERLSRDLTIKQTLYTSLATSYQNARLEEIRATPAVHIVEPPLVPFEEPGPARFQVPSKPFVQAFLLLIATILLAYMAEFAGIASRRSPQDYAEFLELRERAFGWLLRPVRRLLRRRTAGSSELTVR